MAKKQSIVALKSQILTSTQYLNEAKMIVVHNNTERFIYSAIEFFELVFQGEELYLKIASEEPEAKYNHHIDLSTVHNINGILINPEN